MASYEEFKNFCKNAYPDPRCKGGGLYAVGFNQPPPPPIKVGMSNNLESRIRSYNASHPYGIKIHMLARVASRDPTYNTKTDRVKAAEKDMLDELKDALQYRKEWMRGDALGEVLEALKKAHLKHGIGVLSTRIYDENDMKRGAMGPALSRRRSSTFDPEPPPPPPTPIPRPPVTGRKMSGLSEETLRRLATEDLRKKTRSGMEY